MQIAWSQARQRNFGAVVGAFREVGRINALPSPGWQPPSRHPPSWSGLLRRLRLDGSRKERKEAPRFATFAEDFLGVYAANNNKYSTLTAKKSAFKHHLVPAFGRFRLDEIGMRDIETYKAKKLADGLKPKSVNNHLTMLRKALSVAVDWELLSHVPKVHWLKGPQPEFDFLSFEEADRFLQAADPEWQPMFTLALRTGLRLGELRALRWDDVDLVAGRLMVRRCDWRGHLGTPKSGRNRELPLSGDALAALKAQRHLRGELVLRRSRTGMEGERVQVAPLACLQEGRAAPDQLARAAAQLRFAPGDAAGAAQGGAGADGPCDDRDDAPLRAPQSRGWPERGAAAGSAWQRRGNGHWARCQLAIVTEENWWRRRESKA